MQKKLLAKPCPPSAPSRNPLIFVFQQLFAEGECLSRLLPEVSCSSLGLGRAGDEHPASRASGRRLGGRGNRRLKPFSSSDDLCWHQHGGIPVFLVCF